MSKVIIVGHQSIDVAPLDSALRAAGLVEAKFSNKKPQEIDAIISAVSQKNIATNGNIPAIWDGLALELLIENMDTPIWGWQNSEALHSLEYWKNIDSGFSFIFAYDSPRLALANAQEESDIEQILTEWHSYHQKLLQFYLDNRDKTVLLSQSQFTNNISAGMELLEIGVKGLSYTEAESASSIVSDDKFLLDSVSSSQDDAEVMVQRYILENIIQQYPEIINLYEQLQSVADLPLSESVQRISPVDSWKYFNTVKHRFILEQRQLAREIVLLETQREAEKKELEKNLSLLKNESSLLLEQLHIAQEEVEGLYGKRNELAVDLKKQKDQLEEALQKRKVVIEDLQAEKNTLVIVQKEKQALLLKQRELEQQLARSKKIEETHLEANKQLLTEKVSLTKNKQKLEDDAKLIKQQAERENFALLQQMHFVQEELERIYLESTRKKEPVQKGPYGAADRVKSQLSYRIGATMINNSKSFVGCITMPFKLTATHRAFKQERKNQPKLPALKTYQDYYDVARIEGHLSYKLGDYFVHNIKKPWKWLVMPWQMRGIVKDFREQKK